MIRKLSILFGIACILLLVSCDVSNEEKVAEEESEIEEELVVTAHYGMSADTTLYNGPFYVNSWVYGTEVQLFKNPLYYDVEQVNLDEIYTRYVHGLDNKTAIQSYLNGEIDMVNLSSENVALYRDRHDAEIFSEPNMFYLALNVANGENSLVKQIFSNPNGVAALAQGINKEFIVQNFYDNAGMIESNGLIPSDFAYSPKGKDFRDEAIEPYSYNPEKATEAWEIVKNELEFENVDFELLLMDSEISSEIGAYIKSEIEANLEGARVTVKQLSNSEKLVAAYNGEYDLYLTGWNPDYSHPLTFLDMWMTDSDFNNTGWSNTEYDSLIKKCHDNETSIDEAWTSLIEAEEILLTDGVVIPLIQGGGTVLINPEVLDVFRRVIGPDYIYKWTDKLSGDDGRKVLNLLDDSDIITLNSTLITDSSSLTMASQTTEGLMTVGKNGEIELGVAASYEFDEITNTYTFILRNDAFWITSAGGNYAPVTAYDFEFAWNLLNDSDSGSFYQYLIPRIQIIDYEAIDDYTFSVTLKNNSPIFLELMSFGVFNPINKEFYESTIY